LKKNQDLDFLFSLDGGIIIERSLSFLISKRKMFKYLGFLGGKKQIKALGAFMMIVFGVSYLILEFLSEPISPEWVIWVFRGGLILGIFLLIAGSFAYDIEDGK